MFHSDRSTKTTVLIGVQFQGVAAPGAVFHSVLRASCAVFHSDRSTKTTVPIGVQFQSVAAPGAVFYSDTYVKVRGVSF